MIQKVPTHPEDVTNKLALLRLLKKHCESQKELVWGHTGRRSVKTTSPFESAFELIGAGRNHQDSEDEMTERDQDDEMTEEDSDDDDGNEDDEEEGESEEDEDHDRERSTRPKRTLKKGLSKPRMGPFG